MRLFIDHSTHYRFSQPQTRLVQLLRVTPMSHAGQNVVDWQIDVDCDARLKSGRDGYGNETTMLYVDGPLSEIRLAVRGEVLTDDRAGIVVGASEPLPPLLFARPSLYATPDAAITAFAREVMAAAGDALSGAHRLNSALNERIAFIDDETAAVRRTAAEAFAAGEGIAADHAHLLIAAARAVGLPARYVSGHRWRRDEASPVQEHHAAHSWAEVHVPDYGWIGFDSVNDHCPDDAYVRVAVGLDYRDAAPVSGARTGGGKEWLDVGVRVGLSAPDEGMTGEAET